MMSKEFNVMMGVQQQFTKNGSRKKESRRFRSKLFANKRYQLAFISGAIAVAAITLFFLNPASSTLYPPSPFRLLTGLFCPGCGTLRGLHQLLHGHFLAALDLNPLMVLSLPFLAYAYVSYAIEVMTNRSLPKVFIKAEWIWLLVKIIIGFWILRNIPIAPFSWLAP